MKIKGLLKFKIGLKLFSVFLLLVLITSVGGGYFSYQTSVSSLEKQLLDSSNSQISNLNTIIDTVILPVMKDTDVLARSLSTSSSGNMTAIVDMNIASNPEVQSTLSIFKEVHTDDWFYR